MQGQLSESRRQEDQSQRVFCIAFTTVNKVTELGSQILAVSQGMAGRGGMFMRSRLAADTRSEIVSSILQRTDSTSGVNRSR